jgi:hypothetical protein
LHILILSADSHAGRFNTRLEGSSQFLVESTRQPFADSARALLGANLALPSDELIMRHAGSKYEVLRSRVDAAAGLERIMIKFPARRKKSASY